MELNFNFDTEKNDKDLFTIDKDEPQTLTLFESLEIQKSKISEDIEYLKKLKRGIEKEEKSKKSPKIALARIIRYIRQRKSSTATLTNSSNKG